MDAKEKQQIETVVKRAIHELREIGCDAVQIFVSWQNNGTNTVAYGDGNWHARKGMAQEFIDKDFIQELAQAMKGEQR